MILGPILAFMVFMTSAVVVSTTNRTEAMQDQVKDSVVMVQSVFGGHGSGWVTTTKSGKTVVVTNQHVCDMSPIPVFNLKTADGKEHPAKVLVKSEEHDLCLLEAPKGYPALELAEEAFQDEEVYIVGYPLIGYMTSTVGKLKGTEMFEEEYPLPPELCKGKKFRVETQIKISEKGAQMREVCIFKAPVYVTTAQTDGGASGSPLLNEYGEVVGTVMLMYGNISWAATVDLPSVKRFLDAN
jgi:S1-C subfamily serine protease